MSTLTIRIDESLKARAAKEADKLGIPLTLVITHSLQNFIKSPKITIGEPETVIVDAKTQKQMDTIADLLA